MNKPIDRIHDPVHGYGYLVAPVPFVGRWLAVFDNRFLPCLTYRLGFHNCTRTGIY